MTNAESGVAVPVELVPDGVVEPNAGDTPIIRVPWDVFDALHDTLHRMADVIPTIGYAVAEQGWPNLVLWAGDDGTGELMFVPMGDADGN